MLVLYLICRTSVCCSCSYFSLIVLCYYKTRIFFWFFFLLVFNFTVALKITTTGSWKCSGVVNTLKKPMFLTQDKPFLCSCLNPGCNFLCTHTKSPDLYVAFWGIFCCRTSFTTGLVLASVASTSMTWNIWQKTALWWMTMLWVCSIVWFSYLSVSSSCQPLHFGHSLLCPRALHYAATLMIISLMRHFLVRQLLFSIISIAHAAAKGWKRTSRW